MRKGKGETIDKGNDVCIQPSTKKKKIKLNTNKAYTSQPSKKALANLSNTNKSRTKLNAIKSSRGKVKLGVNQSSSQSTHSSRSIKSITSHINASSSSNALSNASSNTSLSTALNASSNSLTESTESIRQSQTESTAESSTQTSSTESSESNQRSSEESADEQSAKSTRQQSTQSNRTKSSGSSPRCSSPSNPNASANQSPLCTFESLGVSSMLCSSLSSYGIVTPTLCQQQAIPLGIEGRNFCLISSTGSGKTLCYVLPLLDRVYKGSCTPHGFMAVILIPCREIALHIHHHFQVYGQLLAFRSFISTGRTDLIAEINSLLQINPHALIATPGRLADIIRRYKNLPERKRSERGRERERGRGRERKDRGGDEGGGSDGNSKKNGKRRRDTHSGSDSERGRGSDMDSSRGIDSDGDRGRHADDSDRGGEDSDLDAGALGDERVLRGEIDLRGGRYDRGGGSICRRLSEVDCLVLDEADKLLNDEYTDDLKLIVSCLPSSLSKRQTLLLSASSSKALLLLLQEFGDERMPLLLPEIDADAAAAAAAKGSSSSSTNASSSNTLSASLSSPFKSSSASLLASGLQCVCPRTLDHRYIFIPACMRSVYVLHLLTSEEMKGKRVVVFVNSIRSTERLARALECMQVDNVVIHSLLSQRERILSLSSFQNSTSNLLVATDVAARGIDLINVDFVINLHPPLHPEVYVHRAGRTARAGKRGTAITLVDPTDVAALHRVEAFIGQRFEEYPLNTLGISRKVKDMLTAEAMAADKLRLSGFEAKAEMYERTQREYRRIRREKRER